MQHEDDEEEDFGASFQHVANQEQNQSQELSSRQSKLRRTLCHEPIPDCPPDPEQFRLSQSVLAILPEELHLQAESNRIVGQQFCWEVTEYQSHQEVSTMGMMGLIAAYGSLAKGLCKIEEAFDCLDSKLNTDETEVKNEIQRIKNVLLQYQPGIDKVMDVGITGICMEENDVSEQEVKSGVRSSYCVPGKVLPDMH